MSDKPRIRVKMGSSSDASAGTSSRTVDSFQNLISRYGVGADNLTSYSNYGYNPITRQRKLLDWMYRGSWIVGIAVDAPADDVTKAGIRLKGQISPEEISVLRTSMRKNNIMNSVSQIYRWARLYGGCVGVLLIKGQNLETPLRMNTIAKDAFCGIFVLDRWQLDPSPNEKISEPGPNMGYPLYYTVNEGVPMGGQRIHHSRILRLDGHELPYWERQTEMGWGLSVLERLYDRLIAFDSTNTGIAQLVYKAHLRIMKLKDLRKAISAGGKSVEGIKKNLEMIRSMQSTEGLTVIDSEDEFTPHTYSFSGLSDVMMQFAQQISGALGIPMVRLYGQTPTGLNTNGESDLRTYYDNINQYQEANLREPMQRIVEAEYWSNFQKAPPKDYDFDFEPLWQLTNEQKVTVANGVVSAVNGALGSNIINTQTAMRELRQSSDITGIFTNITDKDIEEADQMPPILGELSSDDSIIDDPTIINEAIAGEEEKIASIIDPKQTKPLEELEQPVKAPISPGVKDLTINLGKAGKLKIV